MRDLEDAKISLKRPHPSIQLVCAGELSIALVPWAAEEQGQCSSVLKSQASIDGGQSKIVAVLRLRDLETKLAGSLATGFLALGFTGEPVDYVVG